MFFETSILPDCPRYHSNCAAIALHRSVSSNKPFTFTQHHGNNYRQPSADFTIPAQKGYTVLHDTGSHQPPAL